jgi:putative ABC transport system permease protein
MWTRLQAGVSRLAFALARRRLDDDARLEIDTHLDLLTTRYVHQGLSADEAWLAARRQFGSVLGVRQEVHDMNGIGWIERLAGDVRDALRQVRRNPGFAVVVALTLGFGIGGTTAVFSVVDAVLLAPLPYQESGRLVRLHQQKPGRPDTRSVVAATHFAFVREHAGSFEDLAALHHYTEAGVDLVTSRGAERLRVLRVSSGYFETLRAPLALGRGFDRDDEADKGTQRVVLSDAVWRAHFAGNPSVVGSTVRLSAEVFEIAGVAAPGFADPFAPDVALWVPYPVARDTYEENNSLTMIGRLRDGVTLERAQAELATLDAPMLARWPAAQLNAMVAVPLHEELVSRARGPLQLVFGAVGLLLLIACVNVANLALVRATGRVHEFAVRATLGSGRPRLARQLLVENLVLAGLGGLVGLGIAGAGIGLLRRLGRDALPRLDEVGLDPTVLAFAIAATGATAVVFGTMPVLRLAGAAPVQSLRQQSRSATGGRGLARLRGALAAAQVALALTLLAGASILLASFVRLQQVDLGFRVDSLLALEVHLPTARYDPPRRADFHEELARRIANISGVSAAGGISRLPATGSYHPWNTHIRSGPLAGTPVDRKRFALQQRIVSGRAFAALDIPLLAGRVFDARDVASEPLRAVVSANFARTAFPGMPLDAVVGQRIAAGGKEMPIVGVVGDVALDVYGAPTMAVYRAHPQYAENRNWPLTQVVASDRSLAEVLSAVREVVRGMDPELVVYRPTPMAEVVGRGASRERFALVLMGAFALVSLALATLGLYGVLSYAVTQRAPEIGIRMALGATAAQVRRLVMRQAAIVVGIGVAAGLGGALLLGRWLGALAFGVTPSDPAILTSTALLLAAVAAVAAWLPARRAARIEPRIAMQDAQ